MRFDWVWWFQVAAVFTLNFWVCFFSCGIYYFSGFMGLICWRIQWRKGILNEFLHVNFCMFNFLGNLHVLSRRT